jgi:hypothetical protein
MSQSARMKSANHSKSYTDDLHHQQLGRQKELHLLVQQALELVILADPSGSWQTGASTAAKHFRELVVVYASVSGYRELVAISIPASSG